VRSPALRVERQFIGCDIAPDAVEIAQKRLAL
jgi:DNA modification methylase